MAQSFVFESEYTSAGCFLILWNQPTHKCHFCVNKLVTLYVFYLQAQKSHLFGNQTILVTLYVFDSLKNDSQKLLVHKSD